MAELLGARQQVSQLIPAYEAFTDPVAALAIDRLWLRRPKRRSTCMHTITSVDKTGQLPSAR